MAREKRNIISDGKRGNNKQGLFTILVSTKAVLASFVRGGCLLHFNFLRLTKGERNFLGITLRLD